jgi:hypothetical protein
MGLTVELSFDLGKNKNITQIKNLLSSAAIKYNSITNYFIHEVEGHGTIIDRNDCIQIIEFEINQPNQLIQPENILNFIKYIQQHKYIKIDCIYLEKGDCNLIYASKKYLFLASNKEYKSIDKSNSHNILELVSKSLY